MQMSYALIPPSSPPPPTKVTWQGKPGGIVGWKWQYISLAGMHSGLKTVKKHTRMSIDV